MLPTAHLAPRRPTLAARLGGLALAVAVDGQSAVALLLLPVGGRPGPPPTILTVNQADN
jgi:hypothetical protein